MTTLPDWVSDEQSKQIDQAISESEEIRDAQLWLGHKFKELGCLRGAALWFEKAAEKGCWEAQSQLAWAYRKGDGVDESMEQFYEWMLKAANQGDPVAQFRIGDCFRLGLGVRKSTQADIQWYRKVDNSFNQLDSADPRRESMHIAKGADNIARELEQELKRNC